MNKFAKSTEIALALYEKERNLSLRCNHFSFIYFKNRLVIVGRNSNKTHPINLLNPKFDPNGKNITQFKQVCSELNAIIRLRNLTNIPINKCELINLRIDNNRQLANAKPCNSCENLLRYYSFNLIWYFDGLNFVRY